MQKVYERINWENDPSTNTPINEDNLNKMDYAIDTLDSRVVSLYGYQDRVAQAEKNAKTSETNAKTSETNAKQSELKAKEYMERAWEATPDGYDALVSKVEAIDIKKTTDNTLHSTKHGGLRLTKMVGNTEQKKYSGKNIADISTTIPYGGGSVSVSGNKLTVIGKWYAKIEIEVEPNTDYYLNYIVESSTIQNFITVRSSDMQTLLRTYQGTFNSGEHEKLLLCIYSGNDTSGTTVFSNIQLEKGTVATDYEPYLGGVELVNGYRDISTGAIVTSTAYLTNNNNIPCKSSDVIKINCDSVVGSIVAFYYNSTTFVSYLSKYDTSSAEFTVPSGCNVFSFYIGYGKEITPSTAGKVSITVNGKPIYVHAGAYEGGMVSPSPYYPQPMYHTSDVVEMVQGYYNRSNGVFTTSTLHVCTKNKIPCKSGDVLKVKFGVTVTTTFVFYTNDTYVGYSTGTDVMEHSATVPSGATHFTVHANNADGLNPQTVEITLTINGKYVNCIREHGKNFVKPTLKTSTVQGVTCTDNGDGTYTLNGTCASNGYFHIQDNVWLPTNEDYIVSGCPSGGSQTTYYFSFEKSGTYSRDYGKGATYTNDNTETQNLILAVRSGTVFSNIVFKPMIRKADITDDTYEPYQETVAYFLTEKPMMDDSVLFNENGLFKVEHGSTEKTFNGSSEETYTRYATSSGVVSYYNHSYLEDCKAYGSNSLYGLCNRVSSENGVLNSAYIKRSATDKGLQFNDVTNLWGLTDDTVAGFKALLSANPVIIQYELATPYIEVLDTESQLSLHSLKTFDNVTYLEVDSRTKPSEIEVEYGTSQVGAYTLQSLNNSEANAIRLDALLNTQATVAAEVTEPTQATE